MFIEVTILSEKKVTINFDKVISMTRKTLEELWDENGNPIHLEATQLFFDIDDKIRYDLGRIFNSLEFYVLETPEEILKKLEI